MKQSFSIYLNFMYFLNCLRPWWANVTEETESHVKVSLEGCGWRLYSEIYCIFPMNMNDRNGHLQNLDRVIYMTIPTGFKDFDQKSPYSLIEYQWGKYLEQVWSSSLFSFDYNTWSKLICNFNKNPPQKKLL